MRVGVGECVVKNLMCPSLGGIVKLKRTGAFHHSSSDQIWERGWSNVLSWNIPGGCRLSLIEQLMTQKGGGTSIIRK